MSTSVSSRRVLPVAAAAFALFTIGAGLAHVPVDLLTRQVVGDRQLVADWVIAGCVVVPGAVVGALVAARRPGNPLGWMLLGFFLLSGAPAGGYAYLDYGMHHGRLPLGMGAVALAAAWPIWLVLIALFLWLFPDGRLPAGRWRRMSVALVVAGVLLGLAASAGNFVAVAGHAIPIDASGNPAANPAGAWAIVLYVLVVAVLASCLTWLIVQVPKYRRSSGERRQQLKWLYSGAVVLVVSAAISAQSSGDSSSPWQAIGAVGLAVLPVCIGVAVLKYRLYEIDRIISRVISYALLTALLAGVFAGIVLLATRVLEVRTPVVVAASTLAAAALFNPLRKRVQHAVDRRFNRTRYNAEALVAAFTARLRQTVDLDTVQGDLVGVIEEAFQPSRISVWLSAGTSVEPFQRGP